MGAPEACLVPTPGHWLGGAGVPAGERTLMPVVGKNAPPPSAALLRGTDAPASWHCHGPLGAGAFPLRATLVRLLWSALHPERGLMGMPEGWFRGHLTDQVTIPRLNTTADKFDESAARLAALFAGRTEAFTDWICERTLGL